MGKSSETIKTEAPETLTSVEKQSANISPRITTNESRDTVSPPAQTVFLTPKELSLVVYKIMRGGKLYHTQRGVEALKEQLGILKKSFDIDNNPGEQTNGCAAELRKHISNIFDNYFNLHTQHNLKAFNEASKFFDAAHTSSEFNAEELKIIKALKGLGTQLNHQHTTSGFKKLTKMVVEIEKLTK